VNRVCTSKQQERAFHAYHEFCVAKSNVSTEYDYDPVPRPDGIGLFYERIVTPDKGPISVGLGDTEFPAYWDRVTLNGTISPNMRPEAVIPMQYATFDQHMRNLSQIRRSLKKGDRIVQHGWMTANILQEYDSHFQTNGNPATQSYFIRDAYESHVRHWNPEIAEEHVPRIAYLLFKHTVEFAKLGDSRMLLTCVNGIPVGVSLFQYCASYDEFHWINTIRLHDEYSQELRVGNNIICYALKHCYEQNYTRLNMGLAHFEYKKVWKPTFTERPCL